MTTPAAPYHFVVVLRGGGFVRDNGRLIDAVDVFARALRDVARRVGARESEYSGHITDDYGHVIGTFGAIPDEDGERIADLVHQRYPVPEGVRDGETP
jgi:hypothetical protein